MRYKLLTDDCYCSLQKLLRLLLFNSIWLINVKIVKGNKL